MININMRKKKISKKNQRLILNLFKNNKNKLFNFKQISSKIGIKDSNEKNEVIKILNILHSSNRIFKEKEGKYKYLEVVKNYEEGTIEITNSGNGYLLMSGKDIFISKQNINKALNNDVVKVYIFKRRDKKENISGEVVEILKRSKQEYVGILNKRKDFGFVLTRGPKMYTDIFVSENEIKKAKEGEKVVVKITEWPERAQSPFGKIIKVLGKPGDINVEMDEILYDYNLPNKFSNEIISSAQSIDKRILKSEIIKRRDFRQTLTFTIDPYSAKDFDDAISYKLLDDGIIEVGIHIADVSYYVKENSLLDNEAYKRATSVYLVDRVVPMLPENLSNNLCSLKPNEDKYTFSAVFNIDEKGKILSEWFGRTVINSNKRFTYAEVQKIIETKNNYIDSNTSLTNESYNISNEILQAILDLNKKAKLYRRERLSKGALSFDRVEIGFKLNKKKEPLSVEFKSSKEANKLVEEFMLLANKKVATFVEKQKPKKSFLYRVHDYPDDDKIKNLKEVVNTFGYELDISGKKLTKSLNTLLKNIKGKAEQNMIDTLVLRCMSKATYTTYNIGHYGLAFDNYTHFTSPIRRYPDILTHRLLQHYIDGKKNLDQNILEEACVHSSYKEQLSTKAERASIKYMQIKYMEDKIGKKFKGVISGVTDRGIYVEIIENKCEGMISIKDINDDQYFFDQRKHQLEGYTFGNKYKLGDTINIIVKKADIINRYLDFSILN